MNPQNMDLSFRNTPKPKNWKKILSKYPDVMYGITSRVPNSDNLHWCLADIDRLGFYFLSDFIEYLVEKISESYKYRLFIYTTKSGYHIIYQYPDTFDNWLKRLRNIWYIDKKYLDIAEQRGYWFLNNFPRAMMLIPNVEYMRLRKNAENT